MRLFTLYCGKRHLALWWGRWGLVLIARRAWPRPWLTLTTARQSGGTFALTFGPAVLVFRR